MERVPRPLIEGVREDLQPLVEERRDGAVQAVLLNLHPADIALLIATLHDEDDQRYLFALVRERELASDVLAELPSAVRENVIAEIPHQELADLVEEMESDDAADLLQELEPELADQVLRGIEQEEREAMRPLLVYPKDTAGGIMATEVLTVSVNGTVGDARELVRARREDVGAFFNVYVVDEAKHMKGVLSVKDLVLQHSSTPAREAMNTDMVTVPPDMDQEEVANLFRRYDLVVAPVVSEGGLLLGRITVDDVVDVMREEAEEDIARMAGTVDFDFDENSARRMALLRLPWLVVSLFGGLLAGVVLHHFTRVLSQDLLILVAFVPVITAMGGNSGTQAAVTTVRRLALQQIQNRDVVNIVLREARVGVALGLMCGIVVGVVALVWKGTWFYGTVVGTAMTMAVLVATTMGSVLPIVFHRLRVDPAIATGPFVSMSNDVTGLLIYFGLAAALLRVLGGSAP